MNEPPFEGVPFLHAYQTCIYFIIKDKITKEQEEQTYNKHLYQNQFLIRNPEAGMPTPVT